MIIYSKSSSLSPAAAGKLETPIKMIIEHESDLLTRKGGICDALFNVEKSNKFGETIIGQKDFDVFRAAAEGAAAEQDTVADTYKKFVEHIQFMKEFIITAEMMEDANYGVASDAKRRAENFARAYYKTVNKICEAALFNGTNASASIAGALIDLTTADGMPLFSSTHKWGKEDAAGAGSGTQSNFFTGNLLGTSGTPTTEVFEELLGECAMKLRLMKDENGDPLGYTADTVIIPGNRPVLESVVKKVCGTPGALGNGYNDINLHYGNWNVVVLPNWICSEERFMVMSSEANKNLAGNMFFNRVPLTVSNWVDHHTGNYIWNGRCRFGVGFGTYKHILLASASESSVEGASSF